MSADLRDFRGKLTVEADRAIEAAARVKGCERQEIVREVLHAWALDQIHSATLLHRLLEAEGLPGVSEGVAGSGHK